MDLMSFSPSGIFIVSVFPVSGEIKSTFFEVAKTNFPLYSSEKIGIISPMSFIFVNNSVFLPSKSHLYKLKLLSKIPYNKVSPTLYI